MQCSVIAVKPLSRSDSLKEDEGLPDNVDEAEIAKQNFTVMVKYVRREIRSLTDRDREIFFNAVSVLQRVPSAVGQQVYGKKYFSKDYFNRLHLYYGRSYNTKRVSQLNPRTKAFPPRNVFFAIHESLLPIHRKSHLIVYVCSRTTVAVNGR